jgi:hypothetical protein
MSGQVHWQAQGRAVAAPGSQVADESALYVDPGEVPGQLHDVPAGVVADRLTLLTPSGGG